MNEKFGPYGNWFLLTHHLDSFLTSLKTLERMRCGVSLAGCFLRRIPGNTQDDSAKIHNDFASFVFIEFDAPIRKKNNTQINNRMIFQIPID